MQESFPWDYFLLCLGTCFYLLKSILKQIEIPISSKLLAELERGGPDVSEWKRQEWNEMKGGRGNLSTAPSMLQINIVFIYLFI